MAWDPEYPDGNSRYYGEEGCSNCQFASMHPPEYDHAVNIRGKWYNINAYECSKGLRFEDYDDDGCPEHE